MRRQRDLAREPQEKEKRCPEERGKSAGEELEESPKLGKVKKQGVRNTGTCESCFSRLCVWPPRLYIVSLGCVSAPPHPTPRL